ncbi:tRNA (adenosine(37)-N6)-threonylcarbamoyltransferase complex ATPase subunit type 1 TsaE [Candidatus Comchoanobacter bicostacola]|uniref:tRNA threonylcarbamoyladenosine biosynthesis protein TsaE n=1 Tax=Candidatus Comchoanobacter bicostacola TaxID=2919598 RepID=A0ABY5DKD9_9GAMM|nr:tRNA (adenosine(37)-N6)-threonylcarbamoyltransferase complex ATPase subunit type 1 TsaE [Candidatus Comchoanobacter bicostacola]UTC24961.1 tRNA (adenosine(37)-N6)-threonylcarbamoyltransferase complex ATPase subunit type 1 TsaE [Candidatus Comchoanobacter bicostacola]
MLIKSLADTERIAKTVFKSALEQPKPFICYLEGDLGVGKTEFVRLGLKSLGYTGSVLSPTYTLFNEYTVGEVSIVHADFYRVKDPEELDYIGWDIALSKASLVFIEWPEHATLKPSKVICLELKKDGTRRLKEID